MYYRFLQRPSTEEPLQGERNFQSQGVPVAKVPKFSFPDAAGEPVWTGNSPPMKFSACEGEEVVRFQRLIEGYIERTYRFPLLFPVSLEGS
jgi:hypothetical protein